MKLNHLLTANALVAIALGIAFTLYAPLMLVLFGVSEIPGDDVLLYWNVASFARLFGGTLFGAGLLLLALRGVVETLSPQSRRGIISALLLASGIGLFVAATQQFAIWLAPAGWAAIALSLLFGLGYLYFLLRPAA